MRNVPFLVLAMCCAPACSSDPAPSTTDSAADELRASIGPEGGTLEGRAGTAFAGVRLVIPRGALAAQTNVRITPILDETALPRLARRVGQHYRIEPVGTALAMPASLTLPVDSERVTSFEQVDADVKVWARTDGDFNLVEPSATAAGSVTIPIRQLNIAAAGVRTATALATTCGASCMQAAESMPPAELSRIILTPCASSTGTCRDLLNFTSTLAADSGFLVEGNVVYLPSTQNERYRIRRINLTPATQAEVAPTFTGNEAGMRSSPRAMAFIRRANGVEEVWSSHRTEGTAVFRFNNQLSAKAAPEAGRESRGVVRTTNNNLAVFEDTRFAVTTAAGDVSSRRTLPGGLSGSRFTAAALTPDDGVWLGGTFNSSIAVLGFRTGTSAMMGPITGFPMITSGATSGPQVFNAVEVNPRDGRVLVTATAIQQLSSAPFVRVRSTVWVGAPGGTVSSVLTESTLVREEVSEGDIDFGPAVWGSDNSIWIPNRRSPEIYLINANTPSLHSTILLTNANPGTEAFADRCPQFIRALPDRSVIVVTADGSFFRIRRTPAA